MAVLAPSIAPSAARAKGSNASPGRRGTGSGPIHSTRTGFGMTDNDPAAVAQAYLDAWKANDWPALRLLLADDATFDGPLASLQGADCELEPSRGRQDHRDPRHLRCPAARATRVRTGLIPPAQRATVALASGGLVEARDGRRRAEEKALPIIAAQLDQALELTCALDSLRGHR